MATRDDSCNEIVIFSYHFGVIQRREGSAVTKRDSSKKIRKQKGFKVFSLFTPRQNWRFQIVFWGKFGFFSIHAAVFVS